MDTTFLRTAACDLDRDPALDCAVPPGSAAGTRYPEGAMKAVYL